MKIIRTLFLLLVCGNLYAQDNNPYAIYGYKAPTVYEQPDQFFFINNPDTTAKIQRLKFDLYKKQVYILGKGGIIIDKNELNPLEISRFLSIDPSAEKFYSLSPYNYAGNNPVMNIDPDGREFTPVAQKWIDRYMGDISSRYDKNTNRISELQGKINAGGLSDKQVGRINNQISNLQGMNAEFTTIRGEIGTLSASSQIYDISTSDSFSDGQTTRAGAGFDFSTGNFVITMPNSDLGLLSHELKHAYQFETGQYSVGPALSGVPYSNLLYDRSDEVAGYQRGAFFGGQSYNSNSLPQDYQNVANGQYNYSNVPPMSAVIGTPNQNQHLQNVANRTGHAFRVGGQTYYRKRP